MWHPRLPDSRGFRWFFVDVATELDLDSFGSAEDLFDAVGVESATSTWRGLWSTVELEPEAEVGSSSIMSSRGVAPMQTGVVVCEGSIEAERDRDLDPCLDDDMAALMVHCALGVLTLLERLGSRGGSSMMKPTEGLVLAFF